MAGHPNKIGKYDVLREIGRGGMGKVFAAVDPAIGRMVAIKQVTAVVSDDQDLLKRFYREAQSTGKLQHPNIVTLHDLGEQDGVPYLVMEYLEGESLETIIRERKAYTVAEKLHIIIQVCEGLAYAHQRQIIHRDIKPGNVVVLNDGDVKVVDFGIAQFGNERFTRTGQIVGSLFYMSPEQIQDADIDARSDIYSTAIVLYEFLTGAVPFRGKDPASTLAKILHGTPPSIAGSVDAYATELDEVLRRALAKDRNARYTSMEDFAFDLRSVHEKLRQDLITTQLHAAEGSITAKQWDKARELLRQILKLDKQNRRGNELLREVQTQIQRQHIDEQVRQWRQRADEALALRKWEEALVALDQAIKIDSTNSELIRFRDSVSRSSALLTDALRRAESAHNAGDLDGAKSAVEEALSVDPYDTTAKALNAILAKQISERAKRKKIDGLMGDARKEIGSRRFSPALEMLRAAESIDPSVTEVQQLIRSATAGLEQERRRAALEKACSEIEDLLNRDEYGAACDKADEALVRFPQDLGLLKLKGFAEKQREAWNRRQFMEAQVASARQLADSGELLRAQQILNEALERYPDDAGAISLLGMVTDAISLREAQRREAERLANERKRYIQAQLDAAAELQQNGRTAEALKKIRDGLARYADSEELKQRASVVEGILAKEEVERKRAEEEARRKKVEIERTIAESWQLLSTKQTGQAVAMLDEAVRRHPDSADLKSQLEFAQRRLAVAKAERERAEQEARRRAAEIQKEVAEAQHLIDSRQVDQAVAALEKALSHYPDSEELKSLLQAAYRQQTAERAERELAEREAWQKRAEIEGEISAARELLDTRRTGESVARLQRAIGRHPGSEELKQLLTYAQQRLAAEETARKKAEEEERRRRAWIDAEITVTRQWVSDKQAERAVTKLEQALHQYPENEKLKAELDFAKRLAAQEQAEKEKREQEARRRREEINQAIRNGLELLDSRKTSEAVASLEKAILRFPESQEIRMQLDLAKTRFAEEAAERQRLAEEARRRQAEIERALVSARQFLESEQTSRAVSTLELAFQRYPDSSELKTQLAATRQRLAAEEAERRRVEEENRRKQDEVKKELASAARLLDAGQLSQAVESLEAAIRRIPDSEELKAQVKRVQDRIAAEEAARQKAEQERKLRQAEIERLLLSARQFLESHQTSRAVTALEFASQRYPDSNELKTQLAAARQRLAAEEAERRRVEEENRRKQEEIKNEVASATRLLDAGQLSQAIENLEGAIRRVPESEELKAQIKRVQDRIAAEEAARQKAEQDRKRRLTEIANASVSARRLLDSRQTSKAISALELDVRNYPESEELRSLLAAALSTLAQERAAQEKAAREAQERRQKIAAEIESAKQLLRTNQTAKALAALDAALGRYPESEELRSQLAIGREQQARELAEKERAERRQAQLLAERAKIQALLDGGAPEKAVEVTEAALRAMGKEAQLQQMLDTAKAAVNTKKSEEKKRAAELQQREQQARELAERERAERRQAQLLAERAKIQALLDGGAPEKAVEVTEAALRTLGKEAQLQQMLDTAKAAVKAKKSEEKKRAVELQQAEEQKRRRARDLVELNRLAGSASSTAKRPALEKLLRQAEEIAERYPNDREFEQALVAAKSAFRPALAEPTQPQASETRIATKFFTTRGVEATPAVSVPSEAPPPTKAAAQKLLPRLLNKWTIIGAASLLAVGVGIKLLLPSKPASPITYSVSVESEPSGATIQVENQTCVTPNCQLRLPAGEHKLTAQLQGYETLSQSVNVDPQNPIPTVKLLLVAPPPVETAGYLTVKAGLEGADVLINGNKRSQTSAGGGLRLSLDPGTYSVEVEKKGYTSPKSTKVQIRKGQETAIEFTLLPLPTVAELVITGAIPNAQVLADGRDVGRTDSNGAFSQSIDPGNHEIVLEQSGRRSHAIRKMFVAGQRTDFEGKLFVIAQPMATVEVTHLPPGATVKVDGATYGTDQTGSVHFDVSPGDHTLDVSAEGYRSRRIQKNFAAGQLSLDGTLDRVVDMEGSEWAKVENSSDLFVLQGFLNNFPKGKYASQAESKLDKLVASNQSEKELKAFYERFPNTPAGEAARKRAGSMDADHRRELDETDIRNLIRRYEQAFEMRDANALLAIWPGMETKRFNTYRNTFAVAKSYQVTVQIESISISPNGETATANGVQSSTFIPKGDTKQPKPQRDKAVFDLRKSNGTWVLSGVR